MSPHRCPLCNPWGRAAFVLSGGLLFDALLPLSGHRMVSHDAGEHLRVAGGALVVLFLHFAWKKVRAIVRWLVRKEGP